MVEIMHEQFVPQLNEFIELLKKTQTMHVDYIVKLSDLQKELRYENEKLKKSWQLEDKPVLVNEGEFLEFIQKQVQYCQDLEKQLKLFRGFYKDHIEDTNLMLGRVSNHWGGYIESIGVQYLLNYLRKNHQAHTFIEKFKRYWHKSRNIEIDLLALSNSHVYHVEVKTHLKSEFLIPLQVNLSKFKENVLEYSHLEYV
jgi:hypothetical protein